MDEGRGLVLVYTGDGKGKSTAAFGLAARALGHGQRVCIIQFLKSEDFPTGELVFFRRCGAEIYAMGAGLTWENSVEDNLTGIRAAFDLAIEKLDDSSYDLVVLDEINNVFAITAFDTAAVASPERLITAISRNRGAKNIVLTGRDALPSVVDIADLVTEMKCICHYYDNGTTARRGVEY